MLYRPLAEQVCLNDLGQRLDITLQPHYSQLYDLASTLFAVLLSGVKTHALGAGVAIVTAHASTVEQHQFSLNWLPASGIDR